MPCINKEKGLDGRRVRSVRLAPGERFHQISPANTKNSNKKPANGFASEKNLRPKSARNRSGSRSVASKRAQGQGSAAC